MLGWLQPESLGLLLKAETTSLAELVSGAFPEAGDSPRWVRPAFGSHQERQLCQQIHSTAASIQPFREKGPGLAALLWRAPGSWAAELGPGWKPLHVPVPCPVLGRRAGLTGDGGDGTGCDPGSHNGVRTQDFPTGSLNSLESLDVQALRNSTALETQSSDLLSYLQGSCTPESYLLSTQQEWLSLRLHSTRRWRVPSLPCTKSGRRRGAARRSGAFGLGLPAGIRCIAPAWKLPTSGHGRVRSSPAQATGQAGSEDEALEEELMDGDGSRPWTPQEKALHEARLKAKAKRRLRRTSSRDSTREPAPEGGEPSPDPSSPKGKTNDRKSRIGKGRGLPKKGEVQLPSAGPRPLCCLGAHPCLTVEAPCPPHFPPCPSCCLGAHPCLTQPTLPAGPGPRRDVNQLDNVWGVGGGQRPVKHLIKEMNLLLREYLLSGEVSEAEHCLRELEVPHFHHELVYEAAVMVLESTGETPVIMMVKLLKVLWETGLVTLDQMNRGFQRVYDELGDISLDVPLAHRILERLVDLCFEEGVITKQLRDTCPARGRKRFVSEGDGGQIKQ
nr:uncharacterized protein LOC116829258 [Chelonoidis abingdonii]